MLQLYLESGNSLFLKKGMREYYPGNVYINEIDIGIQESAKPHNLVIFGMPRFLKTLRRTTLVDSPRCIRKFKSSFSTK